MQALPVALQVQQWGQGHNPLQGSWNCGGGEGGRFLASELLACQLGVLHLLAAGKKGREGRCPYP